MTSREKSVYRFFEFELDPRERRLSTGGKVIPLTPKVFDTLVLLVERAGHVVTKEELIGAIWPRGFVDQSNLTKHIWMIRRALGNGDSDGEHAGDQDSRFIETVPKIGYRFAARVTTTEAPGYGPGSSAASQASPADGTAPASPSPPSPPAPAAAGEAVGDRRDAPSGSSGSRKHWTAAGLAALGVVLLAAAPYLFRRAAPPAAPRMAGRSVAFVGFNNLSKNPKDAWLAPALSEMLGAELNVADDLEIVPDELVRDGGAGLALPAAGGYSKKTLADLRRRLDADYVVTGSYWVSGSGDDPPLRVDITLQDARSGKLLASITKQTVLSALLELVSGDGSLLRNKLNVHAPDTDTLIRVAHAQPPSVDVARRLGFALDALQHYDAARARDELLETIAQAPGYAPAYSYLAEAWSALGYRDKAIAAAEQAAQHAENLPAEQRLRIEAVLGSSRGNWPKAAESWAALVRMRPADLDYRLRLIDAQIASGKVSAAQVSLRELQGLSEAAADPRVELAAARAAGALDDAKGAEAHAGKALEEASRRDAVGLVADARLAVGGAQMLLNQDEESRTQLLAAVEAYHSIRNPRGEAAARSKLAHAFSNLHRNQEAREEYQRAMSLEQSIGDLEGQAAVYQQLSGMLWLAGDRDGAKAAAQHGLELARDIGDLSIQSWTIQALATIESDDEASEGVIAELREVVTLYQRAGHPAAWPLTNIADLQRMRGELAAAAATCADARTMAASMSDPQFRLFSGFTCALIEMDRGNAAAARAALEEVIRQVGTKGDTTYRDNANMTLAQLDMDEGQWTSAQTRLRQACPGFAAAEARTGEADCSALLAMTEHARGDQAASDAALERARSLRAAITSHQEVYVVDIASLALQSAGGTRTAAPADKLLALSDDAARRYFVGWSLEAKLAAWEILEAQHAPRAVSLHHQLESLARRHGFGRILRRISRPPGMARGGGA